MRCDVVTFGLATHHVVRPMSILIGLSESDIAHCNAMLGIPTNPVFGSLNLAAAVQLIAYDWRMAIGGHDSYGII